MRFLKITILLFSIMGFLPAFAMSSRIDVDNEGYYSNTVDANEKYQFIESGVSDESPATIELGEEFSTLLDEADTELFTADSSNTNYNYLKIINDGELVVATDYSDRTAGVFLSNYEFGEDNYYTSNSTFINNGSLSVINSSDHLNGYVVGIQMTDNNVLTNTGILDFQSSGSHAYGINLSNNNIITNTGSLNLSSKLQGYGYYLGEDNAVDISGDTTILTTNNAYGIYAGDDNIITHSGIMNITAGSYIDDELGEISGIARGIESGDRSIITNTGIINVTSPTTAYGLSSGTGEDTVITNEGNLYVRGQSVKGIRSSAMGTVLNSGLIDVRSTDYDAVGIDATTFLFRTITHTGSIYAESNSEYDAIGISSIAEPITLNIDGDIIAVNKGGGDAYAIKLINNPNQDTGQSTVNISARSIIRGKIDFGTGDDNVFNLDDIHGDDANIYYKFSGNATTNFINKRGLWLTGSAKKVGTTLFSRANELSNQITSAVSDSINDRLFNNSTKQNNSFWLSTIGGYQERPAIDTNSVSKASYGGVVVGYDKLIRPNLTIGFHAGGTYGSIKSINKANHVDKVSGVMLGGYGQYNYKNKFKINFSSLIGYGYHDDNRYVLENEHGTVKNPSNFNEYLFNQNVIVSKSFQLGDLTITPSLVAGYLGQFFSKYSESGNNNSRISVKSRFVSTLKEKAQISLAKNKKIFNFPGMIRFDLGLQSMQQVGSRKVHATLITSGSTNNFHLNGSRDFTDAFIGIGFNLHKNNSLHFFGNIRGSKGINRFSSKNNSFRGNLGFKILL